MKSNIVSIRKSKNTAYPSPSFNPSKVFPEFQNFNLYNMETDKQNDIYSSIREVLIDLELDKNNIGTEKWNPFKNLIKSGQNIVIKPNLVLGNHPLGRKGTLCTITHASLVRPIIDYLLLATGGNVKITICDVPLQSADWDNLIKISGLKSLVDYYKKNNIKINLLDLRLEIIKKDNRIDTQKIRKERDPLGYSAVDLGGKSALMPIVKYCKKLEITDYGSGTVPKHHNSKKNEYLVPNTILNSDLFINMPKLKTHKKAGITFAMKNLIGINGDKSWIAHHRRGGKKNGGDEYPHLKLKNVLKKLFVKMKNSKFKHLTMIALKFYEKIFMNGKSFAQANFEGCNVKGITEGSWYGNDTLWRCIKDLNNIIFFSDKNGKMQTKQQRNYLCIGDGIVAGEGEGPMGCNPREEGLLIGGFNPVYVDRVAANVMGFDYRKIPQVKNGFVNEGFTLCGNAEREIIWKSNIKNVNDLNLHFKPARSWENHIERQGLQL